MVNEGFDQTFPQLLTIYSPRGRCQSPMEDQASNRTFWIPPYDRVATESSQMRGSDAQAS